MELTCLECEKNAYMLIFMWTGYVMTSDSDKNKFINSSSLLVWVPFSHFKAKKKMHVWGTLENWLDQEWPTSIEDGEMKLLLNFLQKTLGRIGMIFQFKRNYHKSKWYYFCIKQEIIYWTLFLLLINLILIWLPKKLHVIKFFKSIYGAEHSFWKKY